MKDLIHIIGLGGGGSNAMEYIHRKGVQAKYTYITDRQRLYLPKEIDFIQFRPPLKNKIQFPKEFAGFSDVNQEIILPEGIRSLFFENQKYILLSGLGGNTGTLLIHKLSYWLEISRKDFAIIVSLPYHFEGIERPVLATTLKNILHAKPFFLFFQVGVINKDLWQHDPK
jgi:cell division GTPase FtsZ